MAVNPNPGRISAPMWRLWEDCPIPGVKLGGIFADKPHYHQTVNANLQNWPNSYSVQLPLDLVDYNRNYARAIDLTMTDREMVKWTQRMKASANDPRDHRLAACKEFYGTLDNKTVFGLSKNTTIGPWRRVTADKTHLWHGHGSYFTAYVNNWAMLSPSLSVWSGESYEDWSNSMERQIAELNDTGEGVRYWQQVHNTVRTTVTPAAPVISVDGVYGPSTAAAVLDFWKKSGGSGTTYKGTYITGWLALKYHMALALVSVPKPVIPDPPKPVDGEILQQMVNKWLSENVPTNLYLTGDVKGRVTMEGNF